MVVVDKKITGTYQENIRKRVKIFLERVFSQREQNMYPVFLIL